MWVQTKTMHGAVGLLENKVLQKVVNKLLLLVSGEKIGSFFDIFLFIIKSSSSTV